MEHERTLRQQLHDFIIRCKLRLGLNTITDSQTIEGKAVGEWSFPPEERRVICAAPKLITPPMRC
jgi:hypothetical protein